MSFDHQSLNGHTVGIVMKELVRRAISTIQRERIAFEVTQKRGYGGIMDDVLTSADTKAQEVYAKSLGECFPKFGLIGEEGLRKDGNPYFTIDPLDGTKAFVRKQSHGVGTMVALVDGERVLAAFIGDINTGEIFGYRPGSPNVHRLTALDFAERLETSPEAIPSKPYILFRDPPEAERDIIRNLLGRFHNHLVDGGSIGIWMARLWKREVVAVHLPPGHETPWDSAPIIGISKKLGYVFLQPSKGREGVWETFGMYPPAEPTYRDHDVLVIHQNNLPLLGEAYKTDASA
jgi:fructose-1,6-bisphosphatase/inositol monophosphatase family enzyme